MRKKPLQSKMSQYIILIVMVVTSLIAMQMQPTHRISEDRNEFDLEKIVPEAFGHWKIKPNSAGYIINPQTEQNLKNIYSRTLSRTYINSVNGEVIMLSLAYGEEQSDTKRLHYPEACYPAQGFKIQSSSMSQVKTVYGIIKVKQLLAEMRARSEPITYWSTVGNTVVLSEHDGKIEQLKYGLRGDIPDGILFRVSSIDENVEKAYTSHKQFISSLFSFLPNESIGMLAGLQPTKQAM